MKSGYINWSIRFKSRILLLFNSAGAFYGGGSLMVHTDGSGLGMSTDLLKHSPFPDFFVPGSVLVLVNGFFSLYCLFLTFRDHVYAGRMIMLQGTLLLGWIFIQIWLIDTVNTLHYIMGGTGVSLIILGVMAQKRGAFQTPERHRPSANINHSRS
jgi:hypothetical protein